MTPRFPNDPALGPGRPPRWHRPSFALSIALAATVTIASVSTAAIAVDRAQDGADAGGSSLAAAAGPESTPTGTPEPADAVTPTPSPTPAETPSPDPSPTDTPAATPTPAPQPTPSATPSPTATPTPSPSPSPSPEPTPSATPTPTPTPTPTTAPGPTPTATPLPSTGPGPVIRLTPPRLSISTAANTAMAAARVQATQRAAAMVRASAALATSKSALSKAQARYDLVQAQYDAQVAAAATLADAAATAEAEAATSTRLLVLAMRPSGSPRQGVGPLDVLFGSTSEDGLLDDLSSVDRLNSQNTDLDTLAARADRDHNRAVAARSHAEQALADIAQIPVEAARAELADAEQAVSTATATLAALRVGAANARSTLASADIEALPPTPADDGRLGDAVWTAPGSGPITDTFGPRPDRPAGAGPFHYAIDIGTGCNAWIVAAAAGTVSAAGPVPGLGNRVIINHGQGLTTTYAHIADGGIAVSVGQPVAAGEAIALSGSTGVSTGCHLHFEIAIDGVRTDPIPFLAARGVNVG